MSERGVFAVESPEKEELWLPCQGCGRATYHKTLAQVSGSDDNEDGSIQVWDTYRVVQCLGCHTVSFCHDSSCSEDMDVDPKTGDMVLVVTKKLYPSRVAGRSELRDAYFLPHGVYRVYQEALGALANDLRIAAGFGIRAIVEAVCADHKIVGKDLQVKIDQLLAKGLITKDGAVILHGLRFMGNDAVHEMKIHTDEEMHAAFNVAENLLQNFYIIPKHAEKLPKKGT